MLKVKLLNSGATLNDYLEVNAVNFIPGENLVVNVHLYDLQRDIRYIPPVAATLKLTFTDKDSNQVDKTASVIHADDRSMWTVSLSQAETTTLAGQNIIVTLDVNGDASVILKALVANGLIRNNLSGDC